MSCEGEYRWPVVDLPPNFAQHEFAQQPIPDEARETCMNIYPGGERNGKMAIGRAIAILDLVASIWQRVPEQHSQGARTIACPRKMHVATLLLPGVMRKRISC